MRSSARPFHLALGLSLSTFFVGAAVCADEPKEPVVQPASDSAAPAPVPAAPDRIAEALAPKPGGLTPNEVGRLILAAKPSLRAKEAELREAAAKVDAALLNFIPRVTGTASYTRLSEVQNSLGTQTVFGTVNGTTFSPGIPTGGLVSSTCDQVPIPNTQCVRVIGQTGQQSDMLAVTQVPFNFPVLLNSYSFTAQLAVPLSDYVLRISKAYSAAAHARDAKQFELRAAELQAVADAKIAFFNWVSAKAASVVAAESVANVDAHLTDVKRIVDAGLASRADVLRLEAQKASAEQFKVNADAFVDLAEQSLRVTLGIGPDKPIQIGVDVLHEVPTGGTLDLAALQEEALSKRLELRQLVESERAMGSLVSIAQANYLPRVDAFAQTTYSNPNQRFFPQRDEFRGTWEAGVRLSWTVNDTLAAPAAVNEAKAKEAQITALKGQLLQGLKLEVAQAYAELRRAEATIDAADRGLVAAEETLRVQTELLRAGRATSVTIVDSEREVTQARMNRVSAHVGLLVAKIKLEHAVGRDIPKT